MFTSIIAALLFFVSADIYSAPGDAAERLMPVKTESPQDTMKTFMQAMTDYKRLRDIDQEAEAAQALQRAIRTLDLSGVPLMLKAKTGEEAAIFIKEVIDRIIVIDYAMIPPGSKAGPFDGKRWRLRSTEIVIRKQEEGEREGEFLFSKETVERAKEFYEKVRDLDYLEGSSGGAGYKKPWLQRQMPSWLSGDFLGFPKWQAAGLFLAILLGLIVKKLAEAMIRLAKFLANNSKTDWDDRVIAAAEGPFGYVLASGVWFLSLYVLKLEGVVLTVFAGIVQLIFSVALIWLGLRLGDLWSDYLSHVAKKTDFEFDDLLVPLLRRALRIFVIVFGCLITIQNFGVNVMSVIAGLGLGGLAFALAAKDTAANLFGSIMILSDQPFKVGDWVQFGSVEGTVEDVGFRSTRVRTFYDSLITVPNAVVAGASVDNYGLRTYRRVRSTLGVTYDTPPEKLEAFLEGIKRIIQNNEFTRKDYFHVVFNSYGASSLDIMLYFFLKVPSWSDELVERQNIYLEILRLASKLGVEFAFPTQTLHVQQENPDDRKKLEMDENQLKEMAQKFASGGALAKPKGLGLFVPPHREG